MAEFASSGVANAGLTTGIIGTALGVLNSGNGNGILGLFGNNNNYVSRETFDLSLNLAASQRDNAILTAELASEKKMVEVFNACNDKINTVRDELLGYYHTLDKKVDDGFAAQAVINCGFSSSINLLQNQVQQLFGMTKLGILSTNIWTAQQAAAAAGGTTG